MGNLVWLDAESLCSSSHQASHPVWPTAEGEPLFSLAGGQQFCFVKVELKLFSQLARQRVKQLTSCLASQLRRSVQVPIKLSGKLVLLKGQLCSLKHQFCFVEKEVKF